MSNRIMVAVGLIFMTHLVNMIAWTYALIAVKIFEVDTNAFYLVGEMYTTIELFFKQLDPIADLPK